MSATLPNASLDSTPFVTAPPVRRGFLSSCLREPLLHFVVLGGLLFAIDYFMAERDGDPRTIVVGPDVNHEAVEIFEETRGRKPNENELKALHGIWLDNEVLYREGLAMQLEKGDDAIRERVIFKALSVIDANVKLPPADAQTLRSWFESHRDKYDQPARYDFEEAALSGDNSESTVRAFVQSLNTGAPGDTQAGLRVFKGRPHENLIQSYGADFLKLLENSPPGQWRALQTRDGWRAMRLNSITPSKPADFESLRGVLLQDWKDSVAAEQRTAAVRALAKKYKIIFEARPE